MTLIVLSVLIVLAILIAKDYRPQDRMSRIAEDHQVFLRWYQRTFLILIALAALLIAWTGWKTNVPPTQDIALERLTYTWGGICGFALSYLHFLSFVDPTRNKVTRFINWYTQQRMVRFMEMDPGRQALVVAVIAFILGAVSLILSVTGVPSSLQRISGL